MKKILYGFIGLVLLVVIAIVLIPVLFKDQINEKIKSTVNDELNAEVNWGDFDLTLLSSFPNLKFELNAFSIKGKEAFAGDTLAYVEALNFEMDLMSAISGGDLKIKTIDVQNPLIKVIVLPDSTANYDIVKSEGEEPSEEVVEANEEASAPFKMMLNHYAIRNARIIYDDAITRTYMDMNGFSHEGNGDFTLDNFILNTVTDINALTVIYEDIPYINRAKTYLKADLDADMNAFKFTFKENEFSLNNLGIGIDGFFAMPDEDMDFDLKFTSKDGTFSSLLSLIPSVYESDMAGMDVKGNFSLDAYFTGKMTEDRFPGYGLDLKISDAYFKYTDLPKAIEGIQVDFKMDNQTGQNDDLVMNLNKFYALLGDYVMDAKMVIKNPETDPFIDAKLMTQLDLSKIGDFIEVESGEKYQGNITANISAVGKLSDLEKENFEAFKADGSLTILNMLYASQELPYAIEISSAYAYLKPSMFELSTFEGKIGESDFSLTGKLDNLLAYAMTDEVLKGEFNFNSNRFDVNELAGDMEDDESESGSKSENEGEEVYEVIEVPGNIDFVLKSSIKSMIYDNMEITNFKGDLGVRNHTVFFENTSMDMMGGSLAMKGNYNTENLNKPHIGFFLKVKDFDIQTSYAQMPMLKDMVPGAKYFNGRYGTDFSIVTDLLPNLDPDYNTMAGSGVLETKGVKVNNHPTFTKIADKTKYDKLNSFDVKDMLIQYQFKDGKLIVDPFDMKMGPAKANISGENRFDQTIKYKVLLDVPTSALGSAANAAISQFSSQITSLTGQTVPVGDVLKFDIGIEGPYDDPEVNVKPQGFEGQSPKEQVQELVEEKIEEVKEQVEEKIEESKEEAIKKAKALADKKLAEAQKQADKVKATGKKAAKEIRDQGNKEAKAIEDKAKTPIQKAGAKKAADKIRAEAEKKAKATEKKSNDEADLIMKKAREQADKIIEEAENS